MSAAVPAPAESLQPDPGTLLDVAGLGPRTFEQSAGFLRIRDGDDPLDMTGVHPETYPVVQHLLRASGREPTAVGEIMGRADILRTLRPEAVAQALGDPRFGPITVRDILAELEKPGRDPRPHFEVARFNDGVHELSDLRPGMTLQGTVTNVAQFGAFVDLGVHQDGLVHVSQLAARFVADAREVVRAGQVVQVRVLEVDLPRKRIALSMRPDAAAGGAAGAERAGDNRFRPAARGQQVRPAAAGQAGQGGQGGAMAAAFARLQGRR